MEPGRNRQIRFQNKSKLCHDSLPARASMGYEDPGFALVIDPLCGIDQFANLQCRRPHGALATGNRRLAVAVVEDFVGHKRASEAQESKLDAADIDTSGGGFVEDMEVFDVVLPSSETLEDGDVFACAVDGVDGDRKLDLAGKEEGEFGEERIGRLGYHFADCGGGVFGTEDTIPMGDGEEWRVHDQMSKGSGGER